MRGYRWTPKEGPQLRDAKAPKSKTTEGTSEVKSGFIDLVQGGKMYYTLAHRISIKGCSKDFILRFEFVLGALGKGSRKQK